MTDPIKQQETERKVAELSELYESEQKERKIIEQNKKLEEELSHRLLIQNEFEYSKQVNRLVIAILVISLKSEITETFGKEEFADANGC